MSKHLQEEEKSAATTTITAADATRHKHEMNIRGDMIIWLAKQVTGHKPQWYIREAREIAEGRHRDR